MVVDQKLSQGSFGVFIIELFLACNGVSLRLSFLQNLIRILDGMGVKLVVDKCITGFQCGYPSLAFKLGLCSWAIENVWQAHWGVVSLPDGHGGLYRVPNHFWVEEG